MHRRRLGIIIYTARLFSDSLGLTLWACAALDTLLAINIDLSMDTVAYRLHMWHWNWSGTNLNPLTAQWFGIPYGNFFGWQMVIFFYSAFSRLFERTIARRENAAIYKFVLTAILALLCSQILLYVMEAWGEAYLHKQFGITSAVHQRYTASFHPGRMGVEEQEDICAGAKDPGDHLVGAGLVPSFFLCLPFPGWLLYGEQMDDPRRLPQSAGRDPPSCFALLF